MKKQRVQIILLALVLIALVGSFFGLLQYNKKQSENSSSQTERILLSNMAADDIIRFSYDYEGTRYEYEKEDGVWYYAPDHTLELTQARLSNTANRFAALMGNRAIENVTDLSLYGLGEDSRTFSFETADQKETFLIGDYNELMKVYYICRPGENVVYTMDSYPITQLDFSVDDIVVTPEETETEN